MKFFSNSRLWPEWVHALVIWGTIGTFVAVLTVLWAVPMFARTLAQ